MLNTTVSTANGTNGHVPADMQAYENDYLFDLLGYRILEQAISLEQVQRINNWVDTQPPRQPGEWIGNVHVHSYQGHDGTNYQNIIEAGDVFEEMMDNPSWFDAASRYIVNDFNRLSIQENFLNVREQGGYIGIHSGDYFFDAPSHRRMERRPDQYSDGTDRHWPRRRRYRCCAGQSQKPYGSSRNGWR